MDNKKRLGSPAPYVVVAVVIFVCALISVVAIVNGGKTSPVSKSVETASSKMETKTEVKRETIQFKTETVDDGNLEYGKTEVRTEGQNGETAYTYRVTYENGEETERKLVDTTTKQPVNKVIARGTKIIWHCVDATSYDKNPYNDNRCTSSTGEVRYVSDSQSRVLDPSYSPGQAGNWWYNSK